MDYWNATRRTAIWQVTTSRPARWNSSWAHRSRIGLPSGRSSTARSSRSRRCRRVTSRSMLGWEMHFGIHILTRVLLGCLLMTGGCATRQPSSPASSQPPIVLVPARFAGAKDRATIFVSSIARSRKGREIPHRKNCPAMKPSFGTAANRPRGRRCRPLWVRRSTPASASCTAPGPGAPISRRAKAPRQSPLAFVHCARPESTRSRHSNTMIGSSALRVSNRPLKMASISSASK